MGTGGQTGVVGDGYSWEGLCLSGMAVAVSRSWRLAADGGQRQKQWAGPDRELLSQPGAPLDAGIRSPGGLPLTARVLRSGGPTRRLCGRSASTPTFGRVTQPLNQHHEI